MKCITCKFDKRELNANVFHPFTTAFCERNNQPARKPPKLPDITHLTKVVVKDEDENEEVEITVEIELEEVVQNSGDGEGEDSGDVAEEEA